MSRRGASVLARLATVAGSSAYVAPTTLSRVPSAALDLSALQANQAGKPGKNFNAARVEELLDGFRR